MHAAVDLSNFRDMTGGDPSIETVLFEEYISSSETAIAAMRVHCNQDSQQQFKSDAHALKGISINLGAKKLAELCKNAQEGYSASIEEKTAMLLRIEEEYEKVKAFLLDEMREG